MDKPDGKKGTAATADPSTKWAEELVAQVESTQEPWPGDGHRSSENFEIWPDPGETADGLRWATEEPHRVPIFFKLMWDEGAGGQVVYRKLHQNALTRRLTGGRYYIADPTGARSPFVVKAYAFYYDRATPEERERFDRLEEIEPPNG